MADLPTKFHLTVVTRERKIIETDAVAKSYIGAGGMRFASDGDEKEPIGERIINRMTAAL